MKLITLVALGLLVGGGCASKAAREPVPPAQEPPTPTPAAGAMQDEHHPGHAQHGQHGQPGHHDMAGTCPMKVEGTSVRSEEVEGGIAMVFTTTGDQAELRRRVADMAKMHDEHHGQGGGGMGKMPPSTARAEDVEGGARLVFVPRDPADLTALVEHVRDHADAMASGRCPMTSTGHESAPKGR